MGDDGDRLYFIGSAVVPFDLFAACALGDFDVLRSMLAMQIDPNAANRHGWTGLMYAAYLGHDNVLNKLIDDPRTAVDTRGVVGSTALMWAARSAHESIVYFLLNVSTPAI